MSRMLSHSTRMGAATMIDIQRDNGKTIITLGTIRIVSDKINRDRYNDLRKQAEKLRGLISFALAQGKRK